MPLTFAERGEFYSTYLDEHGSEVYLAHRTRERLVPFDQLDLPTLWREVNPHVWYREPHKEVEFLALLRTKTYEHDALDGIVFCERCHVPGDVDDYQSTHDDQYACDTCISYLITCVHCRQMFPETTTVANEDEVCSACRDERYSFCDECEAFYPDDAPCHHNCECESPAQRFQIRNDGQEPLANDERVSISLPAGTVSGEGMNAIMVTIQMHAQTVRYLGHLSPEEQAEATEEVRSACRSEAIQLRDLSYRVDEVGATWQTKDGNFTKRLSKFAYKQYGLKLRPDLMSEIGNIGSAHSRSVSVDIEITRDLNQSASDFFHEDSCWWGSESQSRCALKSHGGFGLRTFHKTDGFVEGRAWVMPLRLKNGDLTPTFETETPDAYVVFNGYGSLGGANGYAPARILAHMVGWTYRKIDFTCSPMYVNSESGYLVAPEELASEYTDGSLSLSLSAHSNLYRDEKVLAHVA